MKEKAIGSQEQDLILVDNTKDGSVRAFKELYDKYEGKLTAYLLDKTRYDIELTKDLVLITFARAHQKITTNHYDESKAAFSTWIFRVAYNIFVDEKRKNKLELLSIEKLFSPSEEGIDRNFQIKSELPNPEELMEEKEKVAAIQEFVNNIKNDDMKTFAQLRYLKEYSYEEIEAETGKPMGTVKAVLFRARKDVLGQMKKAKFEETRTALYLKA